MEFAEITYTKTVEGNFDVQLIHNHTVIAHINFPTEELAKEYVDIKQKLKSHAAAVIAEVTENLTKTADKLLSNADAANLLSKIEAGLSKVETQVTTSVTEGVAELESRVEGALKGVKIEKQPIIDTSAKASKSPDVSWQESAKAKVGKDVIIDTSAKVVVS